ncbi:hypothetical protein [Scytonema sp. PRP1]|uniref:hypothetical protein n=1 Tax=Scytonema sp. PRP1 TaxID=3120513 RepID=UPI002FD373DF
MTRQPHDQFAKQYLEELLSPLGKVEFSREVTDEVRQINPRIRRISTTVCDN